MKNQWRMPKGYKNMDADTLAREILKNRSNRSLIENALDENKREGLVYEGHATLQEQLTNMIQERKDWKERRGEKFDNLTIVKSVQNSEYMKSRGERGGQNIISAYKKHYEQEWADQNGYTYNPQTGRTKDASGRFVYNPGWDIEANRVGVNTDTMEYLKETKQYRFRGKDGRFYYLNTTSSTHYDNEKFAIEDAAAAMERPHMADVYQQIRGQQQFNVIVERSDGVGKIAKVKKS